MSKYEELIKWCKKTIKLYNPVIDTIDTHSERFLKKVLYKIVVLLCMTSLNRFRMIMRGCSLDKFFMDSSDIMSLLKLLTKSFLQSTPDKLTETMELFTEYSFTFFASDLTSFQ